MAIQLKVNFLNDTKYARDRDEVCEEWGYKEGTETKDQFIERYLKEFVQKTSKDRRVRKAQAQVTVED